MIRKTHSKILCSLLTASMIFSSIPVATFANDEDNEPIITETSVLDASTEESVAEETTTEIAVETDENVESIPTDDEDTSVEVTEETIDPPITEETEESVDETDAVVETTEETVISETVETEETTETTEEIEELEELDPEYNYSVSLPSDAIISEGNSISISADVIAEMTEFNIVEDEDGVQSYEEVTSDVDYTFEFSVNDTNGVTIESNDTSATITFDEEGDFVITGSLIVDSEVVAYDTINVSVLPMVEFDHYYSEIDESLVQTSELLVQTNYSGIFTRSTTVLSNFDDMYIISFEDVQTARYAYSYYIDKVQNITDLSNVISIATDENNEDTADLSSLNETNDPIANLNDIDTVSVDYDGYVALIDTGAPTEIAYSVIGEDLTDYNGHGTAMYNYILEENPDAQIISIKVADGEEASAADIYAGFRLAIDLNVSVINFSMSGLDLEKNAIIKEIIQEAIDAGIVVIGAAGNSSVTSRIFIPGSIEDAIVVGAVDEDGIKTATSNYNADLYVVAESTSEATARFTGLYTRYELTIDEYVDIFTAVYGSVAEDDRYIPTEEYAWAYETARILTEELQNEYGYGFVEVVIDENGVVSYLYHMEDTREGDVNTSRWNPSEATISIPNAVNLPTSSVTWTGTCSFTSIVGGKGNASNFSGDFGAFLNANNVSYLTMICSKNFGAAESDHALSLPSGSKYYRASFDISTGEWTVDISDRSDISQPQWTDHTRTINWSVEFPTPGSSSTSAVVTVNGVSRSTSLQASNIRATIVSMIRSGCAEAALGDQDYGGIKAFNVPDPNYSGGTQSGSTTVTWKSTSQTQVYRGKIPTTRGIPAEGACSFTKLSSSGTNLAGATFTFSCIAGPGMAYDEFSNVTATGTSGWNRTGTASRQFMTTTATVNIDHLAPNSTYMFHEDTAPAGYSKCGDIVFTTDAEGNASGDGNYRATDSVGTWSALGIMKTWEYDPTAADRRDSTYDFFALSTSTCYYMYRTELDGVAGNMDVVNQAFIQNWYPGQTLINPSDGGHPYGSLPGELWGFLTEGGLGRAYSDSQFINNGSRCFMVDWTIPDDSGLISYYSDNGYINISQAYSPETGEVYYNDGHNSTLHGLKDGYYFIYETWHGGYFQTVNAAERAIRSEVANGWVLMNDARAFVNNPGSSQSVVFRRVIKIYQGVPYIVEWNRETQSIDTISTLSLTDGTYGGTSPSHYYQDYYQVDVRNEELSGQLRVIKTDETGFNERNGLRFELRGGPGDTNTVYATGTIGSSLGNRQYDVNWTWVTERALTAGNQDQYQGEWALEEVVNTGNTITHLPYGDYYIYEYIDGNHDIRNYRIPDGWQAWDEVHNREWHQGDSGSPSYFYTRVTIDANFHSSPKVVSIVNRTWSLELDVTKTDAVTGETVSGYTGMFKFDLYADLNNDGVPQDNELLSANWADDGNTRWDQSEARDGRVHIQLYFTESNFTNLLDRNPGAFEIGNLSTYPTQYLVVETQAPDGYYINSNPMPIQAGFDQGFAGITNIADHGPIDISISVTKVDEETDTPLSGARFALYVDENENGILENSERTNRYLGARTTNANGLASWSFTLDEDTINTYFPECIGEGGVISYESALAYPNHFIAVETVAPADHYLNDTPFSIVIPAAQNSASGSITAEDVKTLHLTFGLNKTDEETGLVLPGAVFALYVDVNGNGELDPADLERNLGTATTDTNGVATWDFILTEAELRANFPECINSDGTITGSSVKNYPTHYLVQEVTPPEGYYLNPHAYPLTLEGGLYEESVETSTVNRPYITHHFDITKYDEWTATILSNYVGDYDATFELYCDVNENGQIDDNDVLIVTLADTDRDGHISFDYILTPEILAQNFPEIATRVSDVDGDMDYYNQYLVRETIAPFDFYVSTSTFVITLNEKEYHTNGATDVNETPYAAPIYIHKIDGDTNIDLSNATFAVYNDVNGNKVFDEGIDTPATTYNGTTLVPATITWNATNSRYESSILRSGNYIVVETGLPEGYFFVDDNGIPTLDRNEVYFEIVPKDTSASDFVIDTYEDTVENLRPSIHTSLIDPMTESQTAHVGEVVELVDTVTYTNLVPNVEYIMVGTLMVKETGEPLLDETGTPVIAYQTFTPETPDGTVDVTYTVDTMRLMVLVGEEQLHAPVDLVSFERCFFTTDTGMTPYRQWYDDEPVVTHEDINDLGQTVRVGEIRTGVYDSETQCQVASMGPNGDGLAQIIDRVHYEGLQPGRTYRMVGHLHLVEYDEDGNIIDGGVIDNPGTGEVLAPSVEFVPTSHEGYINVVYTLNVTRLQGRTCVSFEDCYQGNIHIMWHNDIEDWAQTFVIPEVHTNAYCPDTTPGDMGRTVISYGEQARIVDEVFYNNLLVDGRQYMVQGSLYWVYTDDNGVVQSGPVSDIIGDAGMVTQLFVPSETSGTVQLTFTFDSTVLADLHYDKLVVMETLFCNGGFGWKPIAHHWDLTSTEQTVEIPQLHTTASDGATGGKVLTETATATIVDRVYYENLVPGTEYTIVGNVQYAKVDTNGNVTESGELVQNGVAVTASHTFVPTTSSGYVDLTFTVNALEIDSSVSKLVVFEDIYAGPGIRVGTHADITDENQTIYLNGKIHIQVAKVDADNINYFLQGAEITIFNSDGTIATDINGNPCVGVTNADGLVDFIVDYNPNNTYYAMETAAPEGYDINTNKFYVEVSVADRDAGIMLIPITITDVALNIPPRTSIPPRTGDNLALYAIITVLAACGIASGAFFITKKKKDSES